ncbi:GNAT family N-acetyltransferase [Lysinibacillus sp. NPDC047702]|uniref:GNAT family N-acetyltransferase n=1 Tax=unclassified Lysinibacillus TaxID=2636778 RepID=UPI003D06F31E
MIEQIDTKRLYLRKMKIEDANNLFQIWSDPDVTKYMNIINLTDVKQAQEMITILDQLAKEQKGIRYSIIEKTSQKIIGSCGFNSFDEENNTAEIGYELGKAYWGKGFAQESITALIHYAFTALHIKKIEAKVEPANKNSIKVLEKLKFSYIGTLPETETSDDISIYALIQ